MPSILVSVYLKPGSLAVLLPQQASLHGDWPLFCYLEPGPSFGLPCLRRALKINLPDPVSSMKLHVTPPEAYSSGNQ